MSNVRSLVPIPSQHCPSCSGASLSPGWLVNAAGDRVLCPAPFHGRVALQDDPVASAELIDDLCSLALKLARLHIDFLRGRPWRCNYCGSNLGCAEHLDTCHVGMTFKVAAAIKEERETARLASRDVQCSQSNSVRAIAESNHDCPGVHASLPERAIVYGEAFSDPLLGEMEELHLVPGPVGLSHAEAAVMHAASVPPEQRAGILARAAERGNGGVANFSSFAEAVRS